MYKILFYNFNFENINRKSDINLRLILVNYFIVN